MAFADCSTCLPHHLNGRPLHLHRPLRRNSLSSMRSKWRVSIYSSSGDGEVRTTVATLSTTSIHKSTKHGPIDLNGSASLRSLKSLQEQQQEMPMDFEEAQLLLLANVAKDRAQMHAMLGQQRESWNKLFQSTLTGATLAAALMAGISGVLDINTSACCLCAPAALLNAGCMMTMALVNTFQPSQLAEEQRTATRLFMKLASHVGYSLHLPLCYRQDTGALLRDSQARLRALDAAFPMPLTPGGLEKFPKQVCPPMLVPEHDTINPISEAGDGILPKEYDENARGWTSSLSCDLSDVAALLRQSDIATYTRWAQNVVKINKVFAIAAPAFSFCAAAFNVMAIIFTNSSQKQWCCVAACMLSVAAVFANCFSHDMQLGMVMELYRNSAGYYAEIDASITKALSSPVGEREHGELFRQRVAYQLGRWPGSSALPLVPGGSKAGGTLF